MLQRIYLLLVQLVLLLAVVSASPDRASATHHAAAAAGNPGVSAPHEDEKYQLTNQEWASLSKDALWWISSGTVARGMNLTDFNAVKVKIRVNLLLVGFDEETKDDPVGLFSSKAFLPWFDHVEDELRHTFLPVKGDGSVDPNLPPIFSSVVYDFSYQAFQVSDIMNTVFEAAINTFMRPAATPLLEFQVDVSRFEPVIESFIHSIGLKDSYTLIIWKPKKFLKESVVYGYRLGFSQMEMDQIAKERMAPHENEEHDESEEKESAEDHDHDEFMEEHDDDHEAAPVKRKTPVNPNFLRDIDYRNIVPDSEKWAKEFLSQNYLILSRKTLDPSTCELPPTILIKDELDNPEGGGHSSRGHTINMKSDLTLREMVDLIYSSGSKEQKCQLAQIVDQSPVNENCLVENWVGSGRSAFIDLSAGPFTWGPQAGGTGLKTSRLFPNFEGRLSDAKTRYRPPVKEEGGSGRGQRRRNLLETPPLGGDDDAYEDNLPGNYEYPLNDGEDMYFDEASNDDSESWNDGASGFEVQVLGKLLKEDLEENVFLTYMDQYCNSDVIRHYREFCTKLLAKFQVMEYARKKDLVGPKLPFRKYASFAAIDVEEHTFEGHLAALTEDFGVQLADILSRSLHHLITPVTLFKEYHRKEHWTFQIHVVVDHKDYDPTSPEALAFDLERFKKEMNKLRLPSQEFSYVLSTLDQAADPTLALAYRTSLHTANVQVHDNLGLPVIEKRTYLDSEHLREQLTNKAKQSDDGDTDENPKKLLPIFIFSVNSAVPIFVDKIHQARSLGNMVVAVQSGHLRWPSPYSCNSKTIYWNMKDPTKALLLATTQALFGVLPNHIGYDDSKRETVNDWMWSVGNTPHSITSSGAHFSAFHIDQVRRQQTVVLLQHVLDTYNSGVQALSVPVDQGNLGLLLHESKAVKAFQVVQKELEGALQTITLAMGVLDFETAMEHCDSILPTVRDFASNATSFAAKAVKATCQSKTTLSYTAAPDNESSADFLLFLVILNCLALTGVILTKGKSKARVKVD